MMQPPSPPRKHPRRHCAQALSLLLVCGVVLGCAGCEELKKRLFSPKIKVSCQVLRKQCKFVNHGDPGETCVEMAIFHRPSGRTLVSRPVCSGHIERDDPVWIDVHFGQPDPITLCMGEDLKEDFKKNCEVEIRDLEP